MMFAVPQGAPGEAGPHGPSGARVSISCLIKKAHRCATSQSIFKSHPSYTAPIKNNRIVCFYTIMLILHQKKKKKNNPPVSLCCFIVKTSLRAK